MACSLLPPNLLAQGFQYFQLNAVLGPAGRALHADQIFQMSELHRDSVDVEGDGAWIEIGKPSRSTRGSQAIERPNIRGQGESVAELQGSSVDLERQTWLSAS